MDNILLSHGGGGEEMGELINKIIFKIFKNDTLFEANDSAILNLNNENLAFTTDSFVVSPIFFPGGDIGKIAVCGTINDLCMVGATPKFISCALIIEEGFKKDDLIKILNSMADEATKANVKIVCGDTKVVPKGKCDGIFINTSGIGLLRNKIQVKNLCQKSKILLSGDIGRHGAIILAKRDELDIKSSLISDCKSLDKVVKTLLDNNIIPLTMRDATRGGISAVLNEWATLKNCEILVQESKIKIENEVLGICELLGFEPYELANEGTFLIAVKPEDEAKALSILKNFDKNASCIGEIITENRALVIIENEYGAKRTMQMPRGELLPRIC